MQEPHLSIAFGGCVYSYFAPDIESYCDILLNRIDPIFEDVEGEQERVASNFLEAAASWYGDDYDSAVDAAFDHARDHALQFMEMRAVFLATGVSGLFHLFEKQLYKHVNKELKRWLASPIAEWRDLVELIPKFDRKWNKSQPCLDLLNAFCDNDLNELRLVANVVKHGDTGPSYKQLLRDKACVVDPARLKNDWTVGPYSIFNVNLSVQADDVRRYRDAVLRFWKIDGEFHAPRSAFK